MAAAAVVTTAVAMVVAAAAGEFMDLGWMVRSLCFFGI